MKKKIIIISIIFSKYFWSQTLPFSGGQIVNPGVISATIPFNSAGSGYITSPFGFTNYLGPKLASGNYKIWAPTGKSISQIEKAVVVVEGFDAANSLDNDGIKNLMVPLDNYILNTLGSHLITINFSDSHDFIERNAMFLVEFLKCLNNTKIGNEEIVIIGASMGGLVIRKALTFMENSGIAHECRLFISVDCPNRGATAPYSILEILYDLNGNNNTNSPTLNATIDVLNSPASTQLMRHLIEPALLSPPPTVNPNCLTFFQSLMSSNGCNRGYPKDCKNYGISFGSLNGTGQVDNASNVFSDGSLLGDFNISTNIALGGVGTPLNYNLYGEIYATNATAGTHLSSKLITNHSGVLPQSTHNRSGSLPIDNAPGGFQTITNDFISGIVNAVNTNPHNHLGKHNHTSLFFSNGNATGGFHKDKHCFIPNISALDYKTTNLFHNIGSDISNNIHLSNTPFDDICTFISNSNDQHIKNINPNIISQVESELSNAFSNPYKVCGSVNLLFSALSIQDRFFKKAQSNIFVENMSFLNNSKFELKAGSEISVTSQNGEVAMKFGSEGSLKTCACNPPKACSYSNGNFRSSINDSLEFMNFTADTYKTVEDSDSIQGECVYRTKQNETFHFTKKSCKSSSELLKNINPEIENEIDLLPNPNNGSFEIVFNNRIHRAKLQISDITGKIIYEVMLIDSNKIKINLGNSLKGIYLLSLIDPLAHIKPYKFIIE